MALGQGRTGFRCLWDRGQRMIFGKTRPNKLPREVVFDADQKRDEYSDDHEGVATVNALGDPRRGVWSDPSVSAK